MPFARRFLLCGCFFNQPPIIYTPNLKLQPWMEISAMPSPTDLVLTHLLQFARQKQTTPSRNKQMFI